MSFQESIQRIRTIAEALPEDDPDRTEMLTVEGDYPGLMEWALRKRNEHLAHAEALNSLADTYTKRCLAFGAKADSLKNLIAFIMNTAGERKYQGIAGTASIKSVPPKPVIIDEGIIPERFFKIERSLSKSLVNEAVKAGEQIPGVSMDNGSESCSIRSK